MLCDEPKHGMDHDLLTIPEAAKRLKIGVSTLRRYLRRRLIRQIILPGGDRRIRDRDLEKFLNERSVGGPE